MLSTGSRGRGMRPRRLEPPKRMVSHPPSGFGSGDPKSGQNEDLLTDIEETIQEVCKGTVDRDVLKDLSEMLNVLVERGPALEKIKCEKLDDIMLTVRALLRDVDTLNPVTCCKLLELIELRASGWKQTTSAAEYYAKKAIQMDAKQNHFKTVQKPYTPPDFTSLKKGHLDRPYQPPDISDSRDSHVLLASTGMIRQPYLRQQSSPSRLDDFTYRESVSDVSNDISDSAEDSSESDEILRHKSTNIKLRLKHVKFVRGVYQYEMEISGIPAYINTVLSERLNEVSKITDTRVEIGKMSQTDQKTIIIKGPTEQSVKDAMSAVSNVMEGKYPKEFQTQRHGSTSSTGSYTSAKSRRGSADNVDVIAQQRTVLSLPSMSNKTNNDIITTKSLVTSVKAQVTDLKQPKSIITDMGHGVSVSSSTQDSSQSPEQLSSNKYSPYQLMQPVFSPTLCDAVKVTTKEISPVLTTEISPVKQSFGFPGVSPNGKEGFYVDSVVKEIKTSVPPPNCIDTTVPPPLFVNTSVPPPHYIDTSIPPPILTPQRNPVTGGMCSVSQVQPDNQQSPMTGRSLSRALSCDSAQGAIVTGNIKSKGRNYKDFDILKSDSGTDEALMMWGKQIVNKRDRRISDSSIPSTPRAITKKIIEPDIQQDHEIKKEEELHKQTISFAGNTIIVQGADEEFVLKAVTVLKDHFEKRESCEAVDKQVQVELSRVTPSPTESSIDSSPDSTDTSTSTAKDNSHKFSDKSFQLCSPDTNQNTADRQTDFQLRSKQQTSVLSDITEDYTSFVDLQKKHDNNNKVKSNQNHFSLRNNDNLAHKNYTNPAILDYESAFDESFDNCNINNNNDRNRQNKYLHENYGNNLEVINRDNKKALSPVAERSECSDNLDNDDVWNDDDDLLLMNELELEMQHKFSVDKDDKKTQHSTRTFDLQLANKFSLLEVESPMKQVTSTPMPQEPLKKGSPILKPRLKLLSSNQQSDVSSIKEMPEEYNDNSNISNMNRARIFSQASDFQSSATSENRDDIDLEGLVRGKIEGSFMSVRSTKSSESFTSSVQEDLPEDVTPVMRSISPDSASVASASPKPDRKLGYGFSQPCNIIREPIAPFTSGIALQKATETLPKCKFSPNWRRNAFNRDSENSLNKGSESYITKNPKNFTERNVMYYGRDFLLACANSPMSKAAPSQWKYLTQVLPDVCIKQVSQYFDPTNYCTPSKDPMSLRPYSYGVFSSSVEAMKK